jgi:Sec-independent protein translocase protein TatA
MTFFGPSLLMLALLVALVVCGVARLPQPPKGE